MALRVRRKGLRKWILLEHYATEKQEEPFFTEQPYIPSMKFKKIQKRGWGCLWASQRGRGLCAPHGAKRPHLNKIVLLLLILLQLYY